MTINIGDIVQYKAFHSFDEQQLPKIKHAVIINWLPDSAKYMVYLLEEGKRAYMPVTLIGKSWWKLET